MALFGQDAPDPRVAAGGAALGDLLFGGPGQRAEGVYVEQYKKNADAADAMWQARDRRARAIAREGLNPAALTVAGYDPTIAPLAANVLAASASPDIRNLGNFADPADRAIDQQRQEALAKGDVPLYNRLTALRTDKSYQPARVVGGNVLPDGVGLGDETFQMAPLPQTQARIEQSDALGDAATARAQAYVDKTRQPKPPRRSPVQTRAGTLDEDVSIIEQQIGRPLTAAERTRYLQTGKFIDIKPGTDLGEGVAAQPAAPTVEAPRAFSQDEVMQAIRDARAAIKAGTISKSAAQARLRKHGLEHAAGRL